MGYQMITRTGRNFYEATSIMQNAIRKGDYDVAGYAMWELLPKYTSYLQKRLLIISAEDCYGVITKEIERLCLMGTEESLTKALSLMCRAKKNRDADYVVCNLMIGWKETERDAYKLARTMADAVRDFDVCEAGARAGELYKKKRKVFWETIFALANEKRPYLLEEIKSLSRCNEYMTKPSEEGIFGAKALVLLWTQRDQESGYLGHESIDLYHNLRYEDIEIIKPLEACPRVKGRFPEYFYNWHTWHGKYDLKRDTVHAIDNNQRLLTPLEVNLFDDCSWNKDHTECLKHWNPHNYPIPYDDGKIQPDVKYACSKREDAREKAPKQMSIFDYEDFCVAHA